MHRLSLPEPRQNIALAFDSASLARAWLIQQAVTPAWPRLAAFIQQLAAIDGAGLLPALTIELLGLIRTAAIPVLEGIQPCYTRKALPMSAEDQRCFDLAQQFWTQLGIAYFRLTQHLPPADQGLPLNRAACAWRIAEYCHFLAASECPVQLNQLLFAVLATADENQLLYQPFADPDFQHLGEAHIAGHLSWAFLLKLINPYRLTTSQLIVANRAISRWRELCDFQHELEANPKAQAIDLNRLFGAPLPAELPRWLNVRPLVRKSRQRIERLQEGQSPETLKLGRELTPVACISLLKEILASLQVTQCQNVSTVEEVTISFGSEDAYAVLRGELLNPLHSLDAQSASLAHQRMAMFGFDRQSQMPNAVKTLQVAKETWLMVDNQATRPAEQAGTRHLSPCLIARNQQGKPRLGVMRGLHTNTAGDLTAQLDWYEPAVETGWLKQHEAKTPVFLLRSAQSITLVFPASAGVRLGTGIALEGASLKHLVPVEALERGVDFVCYACRLG